jgi:hypothetical protein
MTAHPALVSPQPACFIPRMRILSLLLATAITTTTARAAGWELHENAKTGAQVAASTVTGTGPEGSAKATLVLHHRRGQPLKIVKKDNITELPIIIELCVDGYESVKGFDFLAFEGPDAKAAGKRLTSVTVEAGTERFAKRFTQGGWINQLAWLLNGEDTKTAPTTSHDFTFIIGSTTGNLKDYIAITKLLQQAPTKIEVTVTDSKNPKRLLRFAFPTGNVSEVIGKLMR